MKMEQDIIISGYIPGAIGRITELHAEYYSKEWGFDLFFESKVAGDISEFLSRFDPSRDGFWIARKGNDIIGSIAIDGIKGMNNGAHLRWFIVKPEYHGQGIGSRLIKEAIEFSKKAGFSKIYLWTFKGLEQARHLYEKHGFRLVFEKQGTQWGKKVLEQRYELVLADDSHHMKEEQTLPSLSQERIKFLASDYSRGFIRHCEIEAIEISRGKFTSRVRIGEHHRQQDGFIHAGVMATMADHTAGYAGFTMVPPDFQILTVEFKINFLKPAHGEFLMCRSSIIREGSTILIGESNVYDIMENREELVAKALVTLMSVHKSRIDSKH